ncbi:MAG: 4Fe-4S binding protein, partial [Microcystaceae cyanobacterium]
MISQISEKNMHKVRWLLVIGWFILITSSFYDPISHVWSDPNTLMSPFRDVLITQANDPNTCVKVQETCLSETPYPMGLRFFWGMIVPSAIIIVFVLGHEFWRRICPLYFLSQIPRRLGLSPRLKIENNTWLQNNHLYLQFFLFYVGLNARILFVNSSRLIFGLFLLFTIFSAIFVVFLYGGRTWCHYVCPFGMVQTVFTGPRGLLDSQAQDKPPFTVTQSMCRTLDNATGQEKSACLNCKSACFDIDSEKNYWEELNKPGRKLVQYGYLGLVIGY